jgi:hypothetical protein
MDEWIRQAIKYSDGACWNNGSWGIRNMRGSDNLSVHATGRAVDLSYRKTEKHPNSNRKNTMAFIRIVTANANALGLECILDYLIKPYGRGWLMHRQRWRKYSKPTLAGTRRRLAAHRDLACHGGLSSPCTTSLSESVRRNPPIARTDPLWSIYRR